MHNLIVLTSLVISVSVSANQIDQDNINIIEYEKEINMNPTNTPTRQMNYLQVGLGVGYGIVPHYPASDQSSSKSLALPIIIYRGDVLKSDQEEGTRAELYTSRELDINMSFGARFSNDSKDNRTRTGLPDLNYIIEAGPSLNYKILRERKKRLFTLQIPFRFTTETNFKKYNYLGLVFEPEVKLQFFNVGVENLKLTSSLSLEFFSDRVANYFYEVESKYANADRLAYAARPGFSTITIGQSATYDFKNYKFVGGINYNDYSFSENRNSPLYKTKNNYSVFTALILFFYEKSSYKEMQ